MAKMVDAEGQAGGQHGALVVVARTDDLKQEVGVAVVAGQVAQPVQGLEPDRAGLSGAPQEWALRALAFRAR